MSAHSSNGDCPCQCANNSHCPQHPPWGNCCPNWATQRWRSIEMWWNGTWMRSLGRHLQIPSSLIRWRRSQSIACGEGESRADPPLQCSTHSAPYEAVIVTPSTCTFTIISFPTWLLGQKPFLEEKELLFWLGSKEPEWTQSKVVFFGSYPDSAFKLYTILPLKKWEINLQLLPDSQKIRPSDFKITVSVT